MIDIDRIINNIPMHDSWKPFFQNDKVKLLIREIFALDFTDELVPINYTFPSTPEEIFAFALVDLHRCKAVIVGMEPYPSFTINKNKELVPEAIGKSFIVRSAKDKTLLHPIRQASLRNFMKCQFTMDTGDRNTSISHIREEINHGGYPCWTFDEWFQCLENNGVLFLNAMLTVTFDDIDLTHMTGKGKKSRREVWIKFMNLLIPYILNENKISKFYLFGKDAQDIFSMVPEERCIKACHPRLQKFIKENPLKILENEIGLFLQKEKLKNNYLKLEQIGELRDNWNDNGASAFPKEFLNTIKKIITVLPVQPEIFPTATPSIQLEFEKNNNKTNQYVYLEFEILLDGKIKLFLEMNESYNTKWLNDIEDIRGYINEYILN